jgi:geranylgeranyl pyrophosphate synthase
MAQRSLLSLSSKDVPPELILRLLETLQESALAATDGQHRDLLAEQRAAQDFTREECIEIATAKAGSIMRLACRLGAIYAGADDTVREQFSDMGELLGIAHQLDNDCHDLYHLLQEETHVILPGATSNTTTSVKTDLVRGKKTLPVVFAAKKHPPLKRMSEISDEENRQYLQALHEGIITTWGICLLYRERARDRLQEIEAQKPVAPELRLLLGFS